MFRGNPRGVTDSPNLALNVANTCLYGLVETGVYAAGMSPALGFIHHGSQLSFVLDIADFYKSEYILPLAFGMVRRKGQGTLEPWPTLEMDVRRAARDVFRQTRLLERVVQDMKDIIGVSSSS